MVQCELIWPILLLGYHMILFCFPSIDFTTLTPSYVFTFAQSKFFLVPLFKNGTGNGIVYPLNEVYCTFVSCLYRWR
jgi:hypothetical protein